MNAPVPGDPRAWSNLGVSLARRGRIEEAAEALCTGAQHFPQDATRRENLARIEAGPR